MPTLLLQIIHVSDLHASLNAGAGPMTRYLLGLPPTGLGGAWLRKKYYQGTMGHDEDAFIQFKTAVSKELATNGGRDRTWLVDTGDLSTWGDDLAIEESYNTLNDFAEDEDIEFSAIYGNHDTWRGQPGGLSGLPLFSALTPWVLDQRRTDLRNKYFAKNWPLVPLENPRTGNQMALVTKSGLPLVGCSLNSILHDPVENFFAIGRVVDDRYWQNAALPPQLTELSTSAPEAVRLVFIHHPVHRPRWTSGSEVLVNAGPVASVLGQHVGGYPLGMLVVSGHTHQMFPDPSLRGSAQEDLPANLSPGVAANMPLSHRQAQLTVGTLSQRNWLPTRSAKPSHEHHWQLLRFEQEDAPPHSITMERIVYKRDLASGPFEPVQHADGNYYQRMRIT